MALDHDLLVELMVKYVRHETLSEEEAGILESWLEVSPENRKLLAQFMDEKWLNDQLRGLKVPPIQEVWAGINKQLEKDGAYVGPPVVHKSHWTMWMTSLCTAIILIIIARNSYIRKSLPAPPSFAPTLAHAAPALPADGPTILTRSDGTTINPDSMNRGDRITEKGLTLCKADSNSLTLEVDPAASQLCWIGMAVSRSRSPFHVRLPDGTAVALFGNSQLKYPIASGLAMRMVSLDGEALFDVARDEHRPFIVSGPNDFLLYALGTSFRVKDHTSDPQPWAVLIEGALRCVWNNDSVILHPAQKAVVSEGRLLRQTVKDSAMMVASARKALYFHFDNTGLDDALRQLGGWYGASVSNPGKIKGRPFSGDLPRSLTLKDVIDLINMEQKGDAWLRLEGTTIVISRRPM
jgi:transmembrane sensor